ncbi:MAG: response regulator [Pseudomonadota bacterium]|nr:response regulator [Pseudomonadota bacterium]
MNNATPELPLVMVVEDELLIAATLEMALESHGYGILGPVATVDEALTLLATSRPDMALIDYRLASTTTEALLQPLQELRVPVCVLTGYSRQQLPAGYADCAMLEKPFRMKELLAALARLNTVF